RRGVRLLLLGGGGLLLLELLDTRGISLFPFTRSVRVGGYLLLALLFLRFSRRCPAPSEQRSTAGSWASSLVRGHRVLFLLGMLFLIAPITEAAWKRELEPLRPFSLSRIETQIRLSRPSGETAGLVRWVREHTPKGSLFVVPPLDVRFLPFRLTAERGVFITIYDINQLAFDVAVYPEGHRRLTRIGVRPVGWHQIGADFYDEIPLRVLIRLRDEAGVDYFVAHSGRIPPALRRVRPSYADAHFTLYDLRHLPENGEGEPR
ncbi:MAG: hypothetical protein D6812_09680, partial [Deltaproteobacteria bacterium]